MLLNLAVQWDSSTVESLSDCGAITMSSVAADITIPADSFQLGRVVAGTDYRIELTQFVPTGSTFVPYFWADAPDLAAFEDAVENEDRVASLERVDVGTSGTLYRIEWETEIDGLLKEIDDQDLHIKEAMGTEETWRFELRGRDHETLSSFQQFLNECDVPNTVERVWNPNESRNNPYGMTAKQREALELAFEEGYFAVPRETSLSELAEKMGITRQSFSRRIARGVNTLLSNSIMAESK
ncbi:helix-turn-helix domain-containing protein [Halorussus halophilus]|uniref:helix-turn-helix domain-containing protein n=1 Tax=Halorussus halophilus TaxID=2650975 RepID=UPI001300D52A|nr:helix-turn-helix domain-containing protein [Halorussus halophilus]